MDNAKILERSVPFGDWRGIHGRTARTIVSIVMRYDVRCQFGVGNEWADARSILSVLSLGAAYGQLVTLRVEGERADEAIRALAQYIERGPYVSYLSSDTGSNSDPAIRDMTPEQKARHVEHLNALSAANITRERKECRVDACDFVPPLPQHVKLDLGNREIEVTNEQFVDAKQRFPNDFAGFVEELSKGCWCGCSGAAQRLYWPT